ncbi:protein enabled isoform X2 [Drosophila kikkawai]|uniref:Protein enabled isoform X2 n=1 Tax=Drosophila kikkawai TaxID=30033 RepID=A0A6P4IWI6_DROKI|nr:protein enabled isoform X1 [Drosophila kikkawai]
MAMKKLYAKTSFTSKKPTNVSNSSPILAYHHQQHQQQQQLHPSGNGICEFQVAPAPPGELLIRRSQSMHHKMSPPVGKSEYYSIEELQELDLLDYRHPMYHHYQQQQQQQRYHEHEKLVLQLPKAGPIYEAPQQRSLQQQQDQTFEQSIIGARASVMVYDDNQKKWVPSGTSSGLSKVQIYHHQQNNTFRVVGRKLQDHEVVINCSILKGLKYNQATATFHQWRDSKYVYGLNFSSQSDAENFARAMHHALDVLSGRVANNPGGQPTNGNGYEEDMGYRTMTSEDAAILRQNNGIGGHTTPSAQTPTSQTNQNSIPQSPPTPQGHHRTSRNSLSAPPAPQPQQQQQQQAQQMGQPGSHYGPTGNGPTPNGLPQQVNPQIPPAPQQQQQQTPQQQQFQQQQQQQYQQMVQVQAGYAPNQVYQQPHYVLSNSNPNLTVHQYPTQQQPQQQQQQQAPQPPPLQNGGMYMVGPPGHLPSSASANSVVYASQQQMLPQAHPQAPQAPAMPGPGYGGPPGPPPQQQAENPYGQVPMPPPMNPSQQQQQPGQVPLNRMSSQSGGGPVGPPAPAPPPPPPSFGGAPGAPPAPPQMFNGAPPPPQPPAPPAPPAMGGGPPPPGGPGGPGAPPPPPPPPGLGGASKKDDPQADLMGSLASQLQQFKLKKNKSTTSAPENSGSSTSSGGSGNYGTIGRSSNGMASMMDEMAKTLARRRAQAEKKDPEPEPEVKQRPWEKSNTLPHKLSGGAGNGSAGHGGANGSSGGGAGSNTTNSGGESPRPMRKRFGSASEETILKQVNGDGLSLALSNGELDTLKAEIVREMRLEIQKVKNEIIDAIKSEFNRR